MAIATIRRGCCSARLGVREFRGLLELDSLIDCLSNATLCKQADFQSQAKIGIIQCPPLEDKAFTAVPS